MDNVVKKVVGKQNIDMHPKEQEPGSSERFFDSNPILGDTFDPSDFTLMVMDQGSITLVTRLNRINHRRVLIFVGNGKGVIGYATGKGLDHEHAMENAFKILKRNLICINVDVLNTNPAPLYARHNDFRLWIYPRQKPNFWGYPELWHMLTLAGMHNF
jgi:ribosomal protein S5